MSLAETCQKLKTEAMERGLEIKRDKTKYMKIDRRNGTDNSEAVGIGNYKFQKVSICKHIENKVDNTNR